MHLFDCIWATCEYSPSRHGRVNAQSSAKTPKTTVYNPLEVVAALLVVYLGLSSLVTYGSRLRLARQHDCKEAPQADEKVYLFGLDHIVRFLNTARQDGATASTRALIMKCGNTYQVTSLGGHKRTTSIEPQNVRAVFASDFNSWGLQPLRLFPFAPFIGPGVMNTDGHN